MTSGPKTANSKLRPREQKRNMTIVQSGHIWGVGPTPTHIIWARPPHIIIFFGWSEPPKMEREAQTPPKSELLLRRAGMLVYMETTTRQNYTIFRQ